MSCALRENAKNSSKESESNAVPAQDAELC